MKLGKPDYWVLFNYGGNTTICDKTTSYKDALRSARECELRGGSKHWIVKVQEVKK